MPTLRAAGGTRFCCVVGLVAEVFEAGLVDVVFGGTTVVSGGTTVVFGGTTVVFGGTTVVFAGGTAGWELVVGTRARAGVGCDGVRELCVP